MARIKSEVVEPVGQVEVLPAVTQRIEQAQDALVIEQQQIQAHVRAVALEVGYQLPADSTDPDLIQRDIVANMRRSVEACLQVGQGLEVLRAACEHGVFHKRLDVIGIEVTVAKRFRQAARKFSKGATSHLLKAAGNQSKLFELIVLDDEEIEELELTGESGELKLDDIATMSVKELRKALRQSRQDNDFIAEKKAKAEQKAESLEKQLRSGPTTRPLNEQMVPFMQEIGDRQVLIEEAIGKHAESVVALDAWWTQHVTSQPGYDPEEAAAMPAEVLAVASKLYDDINRTANKLAALQANVKNLFEQDILEARQHVLADGGND